MARHVIPSSDYYGDESLHGDYQYITLEDIVNNFIMSGSENDYTSNSERFKVLFQARRAFRELYFDVMREVRAVRLDLSPTMNVVLPPDFVNYVRISWVDSKGQLHEMARDDKMTLARRHLQDHEYNILFDSEGCPLMDSGGEEAVPNGDVEAYNFCGTSTGFNPNKNFSEVFQNGRYNIDVSNGYIHFGSEVYGASIVLEYISDGLYMGCEGRPEQELRIHKFAETAVYDFIYWKLTERRIGVPANEKARARKEWFNSRRLAKRRVNTIRAGELRQVFLGANKWVKGV